MYQFEYKPEIDKTISHFEAWWQGEIHEHPPVSVTYPREKREHLPYPKNSFATLRDRWMNTEFLVETAQARMHNTIFAADSMPIVFPNLGPEVFSAFYGCPVEFTETSSWTEPILEDWSEASVQVLQLDTNNEYYLKIEEMTDALIEVARGKFNVGYTDLHGGADAIAAFRDPQTLCIDLIEYPEEVKQLNERITGEFLQFYDKYYDKLSAAGMVSATWLPAVGEGRMYVPSNDFSCMISDAMFEDIFLEGIIRECRHMDRCIYHLDGPDALRYLDTLTAIPEIQAIQWVPGAGQSEWYRWVEVYQRIQAAGKSFVIYVPAAQLDDLFAALPSAKGAWVHVGGVADKAAADLVVDKITRWGRGSA